MRLELNKNLNIIIQGYKIDFITRKIISFSHILN